MQELNIPKQPPSMAEVKEALIKAVKTRIPKGKFGILFSGGIDSVIIAKICKDQKADFICYTAGFNANAPDLRNAEYAAKALSLRLRTRIGNPEEILKKVITLINQPDAVQAGVAMPLYVACEMAKEDGIKVVLNGTGADELFAGYARYKKSKDLNKDCYSDILNIHKKDTIRDQMVAKANGLEGISPFLDKGLIELALAIPAEQKIAESNKMVLRQIAISMGIPKAIAMRPKKAAQYGSYADKAIGKLAKKIPKSEYLNSFLKKPKLGVLFSSGKDSCYALYTMLKQNYEIICLITIKSKNKDSFMFHTPAVEMAKLQSEAIGIPIMFHETEGEKEEELKDLEAAIQKAKELYKIEGIVTGALFSEYQSERIQKIADKLGLKTFSPLWHKSQETEMRELIQNGFEFILTAVAADGLDKSWLGRKIEEKDIDKLVALNKKNGLNVCGEGGEFESLVLNAPFFKKRIIIEKAEIQIESECIGRYVIEKAGIASK